METNDLFYNDRGSDLGIFKKFSGHVVGEADTTMRGGVAGEISGVHSDGAVKPHKVGHRGMNEFFASTRFVFADICVVIDGFPCGFVFDHSVEGGFMIDIFLSDFVAPARGGVV